MHLFSKVEQTLIFVSYFIENCFIDEGYSGRFTQHLASSPINIGGHDKIQPSQVCAKKLKPAPILT